MFSLRRHIATISSRLSPRPKNDLLSSNVNLRDLKQVDQVPFEQSKKKPVCLVLGMKSYPVTGMWGLFHKPS